MKRASVNGNSFSGEIKRNSYPPLTSADIITLQGKPAVRKTMPPPYSCEKKETTTGIDDEWIYFNTHGEDHYFFKDEQLVRWERIPCNY